MTDFYRQLMEKSGFDEALVRHALDFAETVNIDEFSRLLFDIEPFSVEKTGVLYFEDAFYPYDFFRLLGKFDIPPERSALYIYIALAEKSFDLFCRRIDDKNIFFDTMKKLSEDADEYREKYASDGLFDYIFLANHIRGNILRLSGFEYQLGHFEDKRAIILHLPENADLAKENRLQSYSLAKQYFGNLPIIADSWLLYPENKKMLSGDSRIVDFMNDFDIISSEETTDYSEAFHVFGRLSGYSYENLPQDTALQRAYAERVRAGLPIGAGIGILNQ